MMSPVAATVSDEAFEMFTFGVGVKVRVGVKVAVGV